MKKQNKASNNIFKKIYNFFHYKTYYAVVNINNTNEYLTIVKNKKDAQEYCDKYMMTLHADHYIQWCAYNKLDIESKSTWIKYCKTCLCKEQLMEYGCVPLKFDDNRLTSSLRLYLGSLPLNCSFETASEFINIQHRIMTNNISDKDLDFLEANMKLNPKMRKIMEAYEKATEILNKESKKENVSKDGIK